VINNANHVLNLSQGVSLLSVTMCKLLTVLAYYVIVVSSQSESRGRAKMKKIEKDKIKRKISKL